MTTNFLNIMPVWKEWTVVLDPVSAWLIEGPMSDHVGVLGDLFFNIGNSSSTRCRTQSIGVGSCIGSERYRYRAGPRITSYFKGVITIGDLRKTTTDDFPVGYGKIGKGKSRNCTRGNCSTLTELKINRLCIFSGYRRAKKVGTGTLTTQLIKTGNLGSIQIGVVYTKII